MREVVEEVRAGGRREERVVALLTKLVDKAEAPPSTSAQQLTEEERLLLDSFALQQPLHQVHLLQQQQLGGVHSEMRHSGGTAAAQLG